MLSPATARSVTENAEVRGQSIPGHVKQTYARDLGSLSRTMISPGMTPTIRMTCGHIRRAAAIAYLHVTYSLCCTFPCGMRPSGRTQDQAITRYLADPSVKRLTPREHDVARLAAAGLKDIVIAHRLGLSQATVRNYIQRVARRLDVTSRDEVITWVVTRCSPGNPHGRLRRIDDISLT